jgi:hypothetical protein
MPQSSVPRRPDPRPISDRPAFKPLAAILLVPVILLASGLLAFLIAPAFVGVAFGVMRVDAKLSTLGADFTRIPRFPERRRSRTTGDQLTVSPDNRDDPLRT